MTDNTAKIIQLADVKPKTINNKYKRIPIKLEFIPANHSWKWTITITTETEFSGTSANQTRALKDAQKYIDKNDLGAD